LAVCTAAVPTQHVAIIATLSALPFPVSANWQHATDRAVQTVGGIALFTHFDSSVAALGAQAGLGAGNIVGRVTLLRRFDDRVTADGCVDLGYLLVVVRQNGRALALDWSIIRWNRSLFVRSVFRCGFVRLGLVCVGLAFRFGFSRLRFVELGFVFGFGVTLLGVACGRVCVPNE
jgi:hypothetical protein